MRRQAVVLAAVALASLVTAAPVSLARLTSSPTSTGAFTTGTINPPTALAAGVSGSTVTLTWTPTVSTAATGYDVLRSATSGSGFVVASTVTPRTVATTTNSPGNGTWYYVLQSSLQNWRSSSSNEVTAAVGPISTGYTDCTTTAADTGGDGNGYETSPASACGSDGSVATDASSGTNTNTACTNTGKDRHRFSGYAFGLPGSVATINGIVVRLDAGMNNTTSTAILCAQLSWDGGTTWTATKQVTMSGTAIATYLLGGAADTWGRTWTAGQLASGQFRVRVIDVSNLATKTFRLDAVQVSVNYTP